MRNLLMCAMMTMGAGAAMAQPVQWRVQDGGNGHWYELTTPFWRLWSDARAYAEQRGGYLVTITSSAEQSFVANLAFATTPNQIDDCWLGGFQDRTSPQYSEPSGGWKWVTGEAWTFTAWRSGQPTNWLGSADWLAATTVPSDSLNWVDSTSYHAPGNCQAFIEYSADCNNDGIVDKGQILSGELPDANNNGIPDWSLTITRQPSNQAVGVDQPVFFDVEVASSTGCTTPTVYRWQRRNPQVLDANAPDAWIDLQDGGGFINTGTAAMAIQRPTAGLATGYRCKISGGCGCEGIGSGVMYTNIVNFAPACPSDFNNDGSVDGDDVITFFERWDSGC